MLVLLNQIWSACGLAFASGIALMSACLRLCVCRLKGFDDSDPYDDWLRNMKWAHPDEKHLSLLMKVRVCRGRATWAWITSLPRALSTLITHGMLLPSLPQEVYDNPAAAKAKGQLARRDVVRYFSNEAVAGQILERLQFIEAKLNAPALAPPTPEINLQFQW